MAEIKPALMGAWGKEWPRPEPAEDADFHFAQVAVHNWQLPEGDLRKLKAEHIQAIDDLAEFNHVDLSVDEYTSPHVLKLLELRSILAALLPPAE